MPSSTSPKLSASRIDQQLADIALQATLAVAPYLKSVARSTPDFDTKRNMHDPVTVHDKHVERLLHDFLTKAVPGCRFLGEESGETGAKQQDEGASGGGQQPLPENAAQLGARVRWVVDPIDGTANFAAGLIYFCTSVAAELDGKVVAGAITVPVVGESFVADAQEAWHIDPAGSRAPMTADGPGSEATALLATYYPGLWALENQPQKAVEHERDLLSAFGSVRRPGAGALDLAHVAAGWLGASMGVGFGPWDVAAGIHMVRVAGGSVLNLPMGTDLPDGLRPGVVAQGRNLEAWTARRVLEEVNAATTPETFRRAAGGDA